MASTSLRPRNLFTLGGLAAGVILMVFGAVSMFVGYQGINDVRDTLAEQNIVGTDDSSIAGEEVNTGSEARVFAETIRRHAREGADGMSYAELPRFATEDGEGTNNADEAATNELGEPVTNPARETWLDATALSTALETAYFAEQVGLFSIVMGVALLLTGVGFVVLTLGTLWHHERDEARNQAASQ